MTDIRPYLEEYEKEELAKDSRKLIEYIKDSFRDGDKYDIENNMKEKLYSKSEIKEQFKNVIDELHSGFEDYWNSKYPDKPLEFRDNFIAMEVFKYVKINV